LAPISRKYSESHFKIALGLPELTHSDKGVTGIEDAVCGNAGHAQLIYVLTHDFGPDRAAKPVAQILDAERSKMRLER
jgi:hypothetical protein